MAYHALQIESNRNGQNPKNFQRFLGFQGVFFQKYPLAGFKGQRPLLHVIKLELVDRNGIAVAAAGSLQLLKHAALLQ